MTQLSAKVKNTIVRYLQALSQNNVPIKEAILFGSYAVAKIRNGVILILHWFPTFLKATGSRIRIK
jgi:hypothetical protein